MPDECCTPVATAATSAVHVLSARLSDQEGSLPGLAGFLALVPAGGPASPPGCAGQAATTSTHCHYSASLRENADSLGPALCAGPKIITWSTGRQIIRIDSKPLFCIGGH
jgi:hypothetical protein